MEAMERLNKRREQLEKILYSKRIFYCSKIGESHERKAGCAAVYLEELSELETIVECSIEKVKIVSKPTLKKQMDEAGWTKVQFDGYYCQAISVADEKCEETLLINLVPINTL